MLRHLARASAAALLFSPLSHATDQFKITPDEAEVCVGDDVELKLCTRPGDFALLLLSLVPGETTIPGIGTFQIPLTPAPTILSLGVIPAGGCVNILELVPCSRPEQTYFIQGVSVDATLDILVSNPAQIHFKKLCQDWDGNLVTDGCDPDCDGDGVIDGLELDADGDGTPNDCDEECDKPYKACQEGCWKLKNKGTTGSGEYGFRIDGLFGDHSDNKYTFSFEWPGTDVQMCHDSDKDTLTLKGIMYGGLGVEPTWDPAFQGYALIEFKWTGTTCYDDKLKVKKWSGGGSGKFTWLSTGEVVPLTATDDDGIYAVFNTDEVLEAWVKFPGMPDECCQQFKAKAYGLETCP